MDPLAADESLAALERVAAEAHEYLTTLPEQAVRSAASEEAAARFGGPLPDEGAGSAAAIEELLRDGMDAHVRSAGPRDRKSTRLNSSHEWISYAVFCL